MKSAGSSLPGVLSECLFDGGSRVLWAAGLSTSLSETRNALAIPLQGNLNFGVFRDQIYLLFFMGDNKNSLHFLNADYIVGIVLNLCSVRPHGHCGRQTRLIFLLWECE